MMPMIDVVFYPAEGITGPDQQIDPAKVESARPILRLPAKPEILRHHLAQLAFAVSAKRPDLEGRTLPVAVETHNFYPMVIAMDGEESVSALVVSLRGLDIALFLRKVRGMPEFADKKIYYGLEVKNGTDDQKSA